VLSWELPADGVTEKLANIANINNVDMRKIFNTA
jgi:hypothetical protein